MAEKRDYYEVLGIQKGATEDEIKKAFRKKARENHPDLHPDDPSYVEKFQEINEANEVLSDPEKRARYDQFGHAGVDPNYGGGGGMDGFGGMGGIGDMQTLRDAALIFRNRSLSTSWMPATARSRKLSFSAWLSARPVTVQVPMPVLLLKYAPTVRDAEALRLLSVLLSALSPLQSHVLTAEARER